MEQLKLTLSLFFSFSDSSSWFHRDSTHSPLFYTLCASFSLISFIALIQLIRIELRVPEYGWTTQKIFHLFNFIVSGGEVHHLSSYAFYFQLCALFLFLHFFFIYLFVYFAVRALVFGFHAQVFFLHPKVSFHFCDS